MSGANNLHCFISEGWGVHCSMLKCTAIYLHQGTWSCPLNRGLQGDVVYLSWPITPLLFQPKCGGRWSCGFSANENSCGHHVTWSPNKLWRSNSIFTYAFREAWHISTMERLGQGHIHTLLELPETNMSWQGSEPGLPASQATTLAKSYPISLCCCYSEPLQYCKMHWTTWV